MKSNMKKIFKTLGVMLAATLSLTNCTEELKNATVSAQSGQRVILSMYSMPTQVI